jgi:predicted branched-subunit amino acid permease
VIQRRQILRQAISIGIATGTYGIGFGALAVAAGLDVWQAVALSALLFSVGSQFALVGVVAAGGSPIAAVATSSLLGVRNGLYGLRIARLLSPARWRRQLAAQLTIDESTAVALGQSDQQASRFGFWVTGIAVYICWNLATLLGAILGDLLGDPKAYGIDAVAAAAFLALLWPQLRSTDARLTALLAGVIALALAPLTQAGVPVLAAALAAVVVALAAAARRTETATAPPRDAA